MNIKDYKFNVGDIVITTEGIVGEITSICTCEECEKRGFYEPTWHSDGVKYWPDIVYSEDITIYEAQNGFKGYYRIGQYRFHEFNRSVVEHVLEYSYKEQRRIRETIRQLSWQLRNIDEISKTKLGECDNGSIKR